MNSNTEFAPLSRGRDPSDYMMLVSKRLKRLRRERHLVERAIVALTEIARAREAKQRRVGRN